MTRPPVDGCVRRPAEVVQGCYLVLHLAQKSRPGEAGGIVMSTPGGQRRTPAWRLAQLSPEDRNARGKAARGDAPRSSHGSWEPAGDRPDPIALLEEQAGSRVPELVPIRYGRMLVSPGTFYRGAALIIASDLAATPRSGSPFSSAVMRTCPTSGCSPRPSVSSCSTSTTSTRLSQDRGSGT